MSVKSKEGRPYLKVLRCTRSCLLVIKILRPGSHNSKSPLVSLTIIAAPVRNVRDGKGKNALKDAGFE